MADEQFPAAATALEEYQSIEEQMASPEVVSNPDKLRKLGRRHAELGAIVGAYKAWLQVKDDLAAAQEMAGEDADFDIFAVGYCRSAILAVAFRM